MEWEDPGHHARGLLFSEAPSSTPTAGGDGFGDSLRFDLLLGASRDTVEYRYEQGPCAVPRFHDARTCVFAGKRGTDLEEKATLFDYVYRDLVRRIEEGTLRNGQQLPSSSKLSEEYCVGIRTIRDVLRALKADGYIATEERKRSVVTHQASEDDERALALLLARRDDILDCFRTLELIMPPLFSFAARFCSDQDFELLSRGGKRVRALPKAGDARIVRSSKLLNGLLNKTGNPLLSECYASLERACIVPTLPGFASPYARAMEDFDGLFSQAVDSLASGDPAAVQERFGSVYRASSGCVEAYLDELAAARPHISAPKERAYSWTARAGREFAYAQIARSLVSRILAGEFSDGDALPSISTLASAYGASPMTVQKALGILNSIGVAETFNGRGTCVRLADISFDRNSLDDGSFKRDLEVFADALQMLCIVLPPSLALAAERIDAVARDAGRTPFGGGDVLSAQRAIMESSLANVPLAPLQTILRELNGLVEWGCFLAFFVPGGASTDRLQALTDEALACLKAADGEGFVRAQTDYYRTFLAAVPAFLERWGASGMKAIAIP